MVVIYVFLLEEAMYSCCCSCILIVIYVFLFLVCVFLLLSMYSCCCLCILIVRLCILIVVYVFLDAATLTEFFPCFFLSCKANARVNLAKTGYGPHFPKLLCCSMYVLFVLCRSVYCFV